MADFVDWLAFYEVDGLLQKELSSGKPAAAALEMVRAMIELHQG